MIYILLAVIPYIIFVLANRFASQRIDSTTVVAIINTISAVVPIALIVLKWGKPVATGTGHTWVAYLAAALGGLGIAVYSIFLAKAFATMNVAIVLPLVMGGVIVLGTASAWAVFNEKVSSLQLAGLLLVVCGMGLVVLSKVRA